MDVSEAEHRYALVKEWGFGYHSSVVDFRSKLTGGQRARVADPVKLYDTLDRASDKGPLRPAQVAVLSEWHSSRRAESDVIIKLHTGQGKTLVGLLILQSQLNSGIGPAIYVCPNNFLVKQTCAQARQFGIKTCVADGEIPEEFTSQASILVVPVQKLFNGLTKFGLDRNSIHVGTILLDDAHACADSIRQAFRIKIGKDDSAYHDLVGLFSLDIEQQGAGTYAEICNGKADARLPIPYWAWTERESEVAQLLASGSDRRSIKFAWPLIKDMLAFCQCIVAGDAIEIEPRVPQMEAFGTYWKATHRVFMSATVTDDAFLVRGLRLAPDTIARPITFPQEKWSGEKLVVFPSLIHSSLDQSEVAHIICKQLKVSFGVVVLVPSFWAAKLWEASGAEVASAGTVDECIQRLISGQYSPILTIANRYDGIDLPDESCRVLVLDGRPRSENLIDLYEESCRPGSEAILVRALRTVEQGLGRSVRGEKDYSVVVITDAALVRLLRDSSSKKYLSAQTSAQIGIGIDVAQMARDDIAKGEFFKNVFLGLINQCIGRDSGWKQFYSDRMNEMAIPEKSDRLTLSYAAELDAELKFYRGDYAGAMARVQSALDDGTFSREDTGWYLQEIARYAYRTRRVESQSKQVAAWTMNRLLLRPPEGVTVAKLTLINQGRMDQIIGWVSQFKSYHELSVAAADITSSLAFGVKFDCFERALMELGMALGFAAERPDKEWKAGPDCLWKLDNTSYIVWECKNEVEVTRAEINKREAEQMNRSAAWFKKHYGGAAARHFMIHPSRKLEAAAALLQETFVVREKHLKRLVKVASEFFKSFESLQLSDLSHSLVQETVNAHGLSNADIIVDYCEMIQSR